MSNLVSSAEAAQMVGVDRRTFNRWVTAGRVPPAVEAPGQTGTRLFERAVVERFARERQDRKAVLQGRPA